MGDKHGIAWSLNNIGANYTGRGELCKALSYFTKGLRIFEEIGDKRGIANTLHNLGIIFFLKGKLKKALEYHKEALAYRKIYADSIINIAHSLFWLHYISLELAEISQAKLFLKKLKAFLELEENKFISLYYHFSQALSLKRSLRARDKFKAQEIFREISKREVIDYEFTIDALLHLCELLLFELNSYGDSSILKEINRYLAQLHEIAREQRSYSVLAETYLLQAKMAIIELDFKQADVLLHNAEIAAEEQDFGRLLDLITFERANLESQRELWGNCFLYHHLSLLDRIKLSQMENQTREMIRRRKYLREKEVENYTVIAKELLVKWESNR